MSAASATAGATARSRPTRRHLRSVPDSRASVGLLTIVGVVLVMGTLLASVAVQTLLFEARIDGDDTTRRIEEAQVTLTELELEVAALESPARIQAVAQSRLGMNAAVSRTYLASVVPGDPDSPVPPPGDDPFGPMAVAIP